MKFNSEIVNRLRNLQLVARQVKPGFIRGERRSPRYGHSIEFADYREYVPGDDLRQLDWNIYARHNHPFIKLRENEEDLAIYVLLDGSRSMDWGIGDENKFTFACKLAAGIAAISLYTGDQFRLDVLGAKAQLGPFRGQGNLFRVIDFLEGLQPAGQMALDEACLKFTATRNRPGLVILLSDLFFVDGYEKGIKHLQGFDHDIVLLQTLCPEEMLPDLNGELRLIDCESGKSQEVSIDSSIRRLYIQRLKSWQIAIQTFCNQRRIRWYPINTSVAWDRFLIHDMRKAGLIQ